MSKYDAKLELKHQKCDNIAQNAPKKVSKRHQLVSRARLGAQGCKKGRNYDFWGQFRDQILRAFVASLPQERDLNLKIVVFLMHLMFDPFFRRFMTTC